jgi:excisionase family DNA binding protein
MHRVDGADAGRHLPEVRRGEVVMAARLLTARAVADLLGVSTETVLRWVRAGKLPAVRLPGGGIRFREDDLDAWLAERTAGATLGAEHRS